MSNGSIFVISSRLVILLCVICYLHASEHGNTEKTQYERIRELVKENMHLVEPYLKQGLKGMPKEFLEQYKQKEEAKKRKENDFIVEKRGYAEQAKKMFYHAYNSYMTYAFPADELMPLSCKGRVRGLSQTRGEVDDALGRYMLTLVDTLDTLLIIKDYRGFEDAVKMVIRGLSFDTDLTVNLFEANIRVLGGLLGGHAGCLHLQSIGSAMWYSNELLMLAVDLADRFLPAFDTPTGLPLPKINLRHGTFGILDNETCTACAGTLYMEFAALSRYTGNSSYEGIARTALDFLYKHRVPVSDLPGSTININNGHWVRKDTSVGAGIDSYYEYLLKGYLMSGDERLWEMFETQYSATRKFVKRGKFMLTVHSATPQQRVREQQDALQAFWPGIQALAGDLHEAERVYEHYRRVSRANQYTLPEAFLLDERMFWPQYYIRPELIESTYILYQATKDPKYVRTGAKIMNAIENRCKVVCGYAGLKNTATGELEDRLDSFVLAETFKYLFLLFAEPDEIGIPVDEYIFTTEAHIIPLHIQLFSDEKVNASNKTCPNRDIYTWTWLEKLLFEQYLGSVEESDICLDEDQPYYFRQSKTVASGPRTITAALIAGTFDYNNAEHVSTLRSMGISLETVSGGRIQLVHSASKAYSEQLGVEGMIFMKEITEHAMSQNQANDAMLGYKELFAQSLLTGNTEIFEAGKAMFGPEIADGFRVAGTAAVTIPADGCSEVLNTLHGKIAVMERGGCMFIEKVRIAERGGAVAAVIMDLPQSGSSGTLAMSGDGTDDVNIPSIFLNKENGGKLLEMYSADPVMLVLELREPANPQPDQRCGS